MRGLPGYFWRSIAHAFIAPFIEALVKVDLLRVTQAHTQYSRRYRRVFMNREESDGRSGIDLDPLQIIAFTTVEWKPGKCRGSLFSLEWQRPTKENTV